MTQSELVERLAASCSHMTLRDSEVVVKTISQAMNAALARGQRVEIRGFGSFSVVRKSARIGRNPRNGDSVLIPSRRVPRFRTGKALRQALDQSAFGVDRNTVS